MARIASPQPASQRHTRAGAGAWFLTVFSVVWNAMVWALLMPSDAPTWFKVAFGLAGGLVVWGSVVAWRHRIRGGGLDLHLSQDPVPHGVPVEARFTLNKPLAVDTWTLNALVETSEGPQSGFGEVWKGDFPLTTVPAMVDGVVGVQSLQATFALPVDVPSTLDRHFRAKLTLQGDALTWSFALRTRPAMASELAFHEGASAPAAVVTLPAMSAEDLSRVDRFHRWVPWLKWGVHAVVLGFLGWQAWSIVRPLIMDRPGALATPTEMSIAEGALSTQIDTAAFPITLGNWLINDWRFRAHLEGVAEVHQGELRVRVSSLALMPVNACTVAGDCRIEGVGLLLAQEGGEHFRTLAESELLPWPVDLAEQRRVLRRDGVWVLKLPDVLPRDGVRLKLVAKSTRTDPQTGQAVEAWVYPSHGNHLALHRALTLAAPPGATVSDPCERMASASDAVQATCNERLSALLDGRSQSERDALLIDAIAHFNRDAVPLLLGAGANANATVPNQPGPTALGMAAAGNQIDSVAALLKAGADVNRRLSNDDGVIIMPLTQALRRDSAHAVEALLLAGASLENGDPKGGTVMNIAAYEGATHSIPLLVKGGGNVNERTPVGRQQIALHTALQHAPKATIEAFLAAGASLTETDHQGENACGWARFFKRSAEIQQLVCAN